MGWLDFFKGPDIDAGVAQFLGTPGAALLDVRTPQEYRMGHIASSQNLPLQEIARAAQLFPQKETPLFIYCQSGARSRSAAAYLKRMGYTSVNDLGGINHYHGKVVGGI